MSAKKHIAIVGGGLGGLAAAIALRQRDFDVEVYEQAAELGAFGAGINLSANAVKVFDALGLKGRLHEVSFEPQGHAWRNWTSGVAARLLPLDESVSRYGSNYYIMHRGDLHRLLCEALPASIIHLNKRCVAVESQDQSASVTFADGTTIQADAVIGADGIHSAVRRHVFGGAGARYAGTMCWRSLLSVADLPADIHDRCVNHWTGVGHNRFVISYFVRQGKYINILAVMRQPEWHSESWSVPSTREEMLESFSDVGPNLARLLGHAKDVYKWGQFTGEPAAQWTKGRVTLLGDAAHAMLATWGQGACMSFEDSYILARWLARYRDDLPAGLLRYEAIRKPRATRIQAMSRLEVRFKKQSSIWDKLYREWIYLSRFGSTTPGIYRWIYGYDPIKQWEQAA
ncbi:MAG: FAD-binding protein [Betaproteobacteria bacterium]|nr:FAD-binding protein [Betaproteobacteria bacterium]